MTSGIGLLEDLVKTAYEQGASDIHLEGGLPPALRKNGDISFLPDPIKPSLMREWILSILGKERWEYLKLRKSIDFSENLGNVRCRLNAFFSFRGLSLAVRLLQDRKTTIKSLNLHPSFENIANFEQGLILVCGVTGSGKSTTLAAIIHEINRKKSKNIITIENPVEYVMTPIRSLIRQREVGVSVLGFAEGIREAMREDPDVIMVGEIRDEETAMAAMGAADTGHLILSTIHSSNSAEAIQRLTNIFPSERRENAFSQLAGCLKAIICQKLIYLPEKKLRVPICEIMIPTSATRGLLYSSKLSGIKDTILSGRDQGSMTFEWYKEWLDQKDHFHQPSIQPISSSNELSRQPDKEAWKIASKPSHQISPTTSSDRDSIEIPDDSDDLHKIIQDLESEN